MTISTDKKAWLLAVICGLTIPAVLLALDNLGLKWLILGLAATVFFFLTAPLPDKETIILLLFAGCLCVDLDVNFFVSYKFMKFHTTSAGYSLGVADVLLFLLYAFWIKRCIKEPQRIDRRLIYFLVLYLVFFMLMMLSMANADDVILSLYELKKRILPLFALIYLGINIRNPGSVKKITVMIFLGMVASSFVGILQYVTGKNLGLSIFGEAQELFDQNVVGSSEIIHRVSGLMPHSNMFGMYLALVLPIAFSLTFADIEKPFKYFSFVVSLIGGLALLLSFSRAAIMSFSFTMFILFAVKNKNLFYRHNHKIFLMYGVLMVGLIAVFWNKLMERFLASPASNLSYRFLLNEGALKMIERHPLLGVGLNNFPVQLEFYDTHGVVAYSRYPVHNLYLLIAAETGLPALVMWLAFVMAIIFVALSIYRQCQDPWLKNFSLGVVCGIITVLSQGLVDFSFVIQPLYLLFFVICALLLAIRFNMNKGM